MKCSHCGSTEHVKDYYGKYLCFMCVEPKYQSQVAEISREISLRKAG